MPRSHGAFRPATRIPGLATTTLRIDYEANTPGRGGPSVATRPSATFPMRQAATALLANAAGVFDVTLNESIRVRPDESKLPRVPPSIGSVESLGVKPTCRWLSIKVEDEKDATRVLTMNIDPRTAPPFTAVNVSLRRRRGG